MSDGKETEEEREDRMKGHDLAAAVGMTDDTKALLLETIDKVGSISKTRGVHFRKTLIDFLARAIHAAHVIGEQEGPDGIERFEADLKKAVESYIGS